MPCAKAISEMTRSELNYADKLAFDADFAEMARPDLLSKIVAFVGAERAWVGLLGGEDGEIERIVTSTMMPDRGTMFALTAISKIILSTCLERESDGWHLCTLPSTNSSDGAHVAQKSVDSGGTRLYASSVFMFCGQYKIVYFFEFTSKMHAHMDSIKKNLRYVRLELDRSLDFSAQIVQRSTSIAVEMFDYLGIAAAIAMGASLEVTRSNRAFRPYLSETDRLKSEQLGRARPTDGARDGRIVAALTRLAASLRGAAATTLPQQFIPIPAQGDQPPLLMHVIRDDDHLISGPLVVPTFLVLVTHVVRPAVPKEDVLQKLFAMTAAEARVAHSIAAGDKLEEIAGKTGVTVGTVRFHLKGVFAKTGLVRQADLVGLLSGLSVLRRSR